MKLSPLEQYYLDIKKNIIKYDETQNNAVKHLQILYNKLISSFWNYLKYKIFCKFYSKLKIKSLYFWGGVGRGKTYLMDLFYNCLPFKEKVRMHFNRFMLHINKELDKYKGQKNPLKLIAKFFANKVRIICLDEFYVENIVDAMILGNLLKYLFYEEVVIVITSNIYPDRLYKNGLYRERVIEYINLLFIYCDIINIDSGIDYRKRPIKQDNIFYIKNYNFSEKILYKKFINLTKNKGFINKDIIINNRILNVKRFYKGVIWMDFYKLCDGTISKYDYIELSKKYHTVIISCIPSMSKNQISRFITMIDEFYDRAVKIIMTIEVDINCIYKNDEDLIVEVERTISRLNDMCSKEYISLYHKL
ncbi:putative conserved protein with nucleoside triphosphate hydrolase domain [Candidatus Johnevansia muelleri]|uniref:Putative conserved protein with nucleoside triphosphate hydrolase domain n=1 Tax=Candidatus Johnevansia muelleri TaxID=1495769 RepID=A0A078KII6_9GAMM|nr:putative conserved protein with nucleoside triphosphate hydrolase domain [Candidatus Evansia muelleri]